MRSHRREKVFGPGRAVPLDRNAKARIAAYSRAWDRRVRPCRPGRSGRPDVGVSQRPLWRLLPQLRDDRREERLCPLHRR
jgi:hypothetical protein